MFDTTPMSNHYFSERNNFQSGKPSNESFLFEGHKLCNSCFTKRENRAKKISTENIMTNNWGLYLIPIISNALLASRVNKCNKFPDGNIYHVYIDVFHEQWSKNSRSGKCANCYCFNDTYYQLESSELDLSNLF